MPPTGHWKTLTFIAALRHDRIDAPWVIDGPINGEVFRLYVEAVLAPTLSAGDIVVGGQPGQPQRPRRPRRYKGEGGALDLPATLQPGPEPHRADVLKAQTPLMRRAQPRDVEATWRKAGQLLDLFRPQECANYLVNSGYGSA